LYVLAKKTSRAFTIKPLEGGGAWQWGFREFKDTKTPPLQEQRGLYHQTMG